MRVQAKLRGCSLHGRGEKSVSERKGNEGTMINDEGARRNQEGGGGRRGDGGREVKEERKEEEAIEGKGKTMR